MERDSKGRFITQEAAAKLKTPEERIKALKLAWKAKQDAREQATKLVKTVLKGLKRDINDIFKKAGVWYSMDDYIKDYPKMRKQDDRNADQFMIDHAIELWQETDGHIHSFNEKQLWNRSDFGPEKTA